MWLVATGVCVCCVDMRRVQLSNLCVRRRRRIQTEEARTAERDRERRRATAGAETHVCVEIFRGETERTSFYEQIGPFTLEDSTYVASRHQQRVARRNAAKHARALTHSLRSRTERCR